MTPDEHASATAPQLDRLRHDVRSPLMVIVGFARLLGGDRELSADERREYAQRIEDAAGDIRRVVDETVG